MHCTNCDLCKTATNTCIIGKGDESATIMFIQDCIDEVDDTKGECFCGNSCIAFERALERRGISIQSCYFTSLIKCKYEGKVIPNNSLKMCSQILLAEVKALDPDIIVPMGNRSLKLFTGYVGLLKVRGNAREYEILSRKRIVFPIINPKMVPKKPLYKDYILKDLDSLKSVILNGITPISNTNYRYLETLDEVLEELDRLNSESNRIVFDLETTGKSPYEDYSKIVCISLTDDERYGVAIPLFKTDTPFSPDELNQIIKVLKELLENETICKSAHNGKFDIEWLKVCLNIDVKNFDFDTMIGHYISISEEQGTQGLKSQAWEFTDMGGYDNELDEYVSKLSDGEGVYSRYNYDRIPWNILRTYAVADVDCCLRLVNIYKPLIDGNTKWKTLMKDILMPVSYALRDMEINGMKFDVEKSKQFIVDYNAEIQRITNKLSNFPEVLQLEKEKQNYVKERETIKLIAPKDRTPSEKAKFKDYKKFENYKFNFGSTSQLRELLFDKLHLITTIKTEKGDPSTSEPAMKEMQKQHPIPSLILELRKINTLNSMFITKLPTMVTKGDIIHSFFNITGTVTGRLSSENPNFQQLPRKAEENPLLFQYHHEPKSLFISRFGNNGAILNADFSALEMRLSAIISNDKKMTQAFLSGADIHKANASYIWRIPIDQVTKDLRTKAKSLGFGILYGKSGITFAKELYYDPSGKDTNKTTDWEKAKKEGFDLVDHFLGTFKDLARWIKSTKDFAYKNGYVETMFGRRRRLPDLQSHVSTLQSNAERQAINAPIQGTGSDMTLLSVIKINQWIKENNFKSLLVATVHDSIVFDIYLPELSTLSQVIKTIMETVHKPYITTEVPIIAELELGINYGETYDITLDECKSLQSTSEFNEFIHKKALLKYQKEILFLKTYGWGYKQVIQYLHSHNRPIKELIPYLVEVYSN